MQKSHNSRLQAITEAHEAKLEEVRKAASAGAVEQLKAELEASKNENNNTIPPLLGVTDFDFH